MRTQRIFWLGNHTTGANWDTVEQLLFCAAEDEGANICNPCFTPLTSWEEQAKAAIMAARQESLGLAKDGKTLLGPVLPRLLAQHGKGAPGGETGGGGGPPAARLLYSSPASTSRKENVSSQNAGARAAAAAAAAGAVTRAAPAVVNP